MQKLAKQKIAIIILSWEENVPQQRKSKSNIGQIVFGSILSLLLYFLVHFCSNENSKFFQTLMIKKRKEYVIWFHEQPFFTKRMAWKSNLRNKLRKNRKWYI